MTRLALCTSSILSNIGIVCVVICLSTNYWVSRKRSTFERNEGLWVRCQIDKTGGKETFYCARLYNGFSNLPAKYIAVVSLMFLACFIQLINLIVSIVAYFMDRTPSKWLCALEILTILCVIGGLSTYVRYYDKKYYKLDWSYIVGWVGVCFLFTSVVFVVIGIEKKRTVY